MTPTQLAPPRVEAAPPGASALPAASRHPAQDAPPQPRIIPRPASIEPLLLDFLAYLELERGLSRNTLEAYRSDLLQLGEFLQRRGLTATAATHGDLAAFLSQLGVAPSTLARKVACLRSFYRHLRREGGIEHDPTADLRGPRKPQRLPQSADARGGRRGCSASRRGRSRWRCATARCSS